MKKATVVRNNCDCHPETCCCNDWLVLDKQGVKIDTFYAKESAVRVANTLNENDLLKMEVERLTKQASNTSINAQSPTKI